MPSNGHVLFESFRFTCFPDLRWKSNGLRYLQITTFYFPETMGFGVRKLKIKTIALRLPAHLNNYPKNVHC